MSRGQGWCSWVLLAVSLLSVGTVAPAGAAPLAIPLTVDYLVLNAAVRERLYTGPGGRAEFWRGASDCGHLNATDPRFSSRDPNLRFESAADLQAALEVGEQCLNLMSWTGKIAADTVPRIDGWSLKFHVVNVEFINPDGSTIGGSAFGLAKDALLAQLESFSYDLRPDVQRLRAIGDSAAPEVAAELKPVLDSIALDQTVVILPDGVKLTLRMEAPAELVAANPAPMSEAQRAEFAAAAGKMRDFLGTVATQMQTLIVDPQLSNQLQEITASVRTQLDAAVKSPPASGDPIPLFREQWGRLRSLAVTAAHQGLFGTHTVEALETIMGADAVFALDRQAPALGSRIAQAGLNSLATEIAPSGPNASQS